MGKAQNSKPSNSDLKEPCGGPHVAVRGTLEGEDDCSSRSGGWRGWRGKGTRWNGAIGAREVLSSPPTLTRHVLHGAALLRNPKCRLNAVNEGKF